MRLALWSAIVGQSFLGLVTCSALAWCRAWTWVTRLASAMNFTTVVITWTNPVFSTNAGDVPPFAARSCVRLL
jgi:hypothetical protein